MQDRSNPVKYDVQYETYNGSRKPLLPPEQAVHHPLSLLASQAITKQRALENDIWNRSVLNSTRLWRQGGMLLEPHTEVALLPLIYCSHPDGALMNIITGPIAHPDVNAGDAVSLGQRAMSNFKAGRPGSFYGPLGKLVFTMDVKKKHVLVGKERVYDKDLIDARVIGLLSTSREINFDYVLAYKLAAHPPLMFNPCGQIKITSKSTLKLKLQVVISEGNCSIPATLIYDVSALLWVVTRPYDKLHVYVDAFLLFVHQALQKSNVTLVFDRYFSIPPRTSRRCRDGSNRVHNGSNRRRRFN